VVTLALSVIIIFFSSLFRSRHIVVVHVSNECGKKSLPKSKFSKLLLPAVVSPEEKNYNEQKMANAY
jgi:hypothetical protein